MQAASLAFVERMNSGYAMALLRHGFMAAALLLLTHHAAQAQVCLDSTTDTSSSSGSGSGLGVNVSIGGLGVGSGGGAQNNRFYISCDTTYKETELMCDNITVYPSCPAEPMPMRDTELKSFITDFTPYLYAYARDPEDPSKPYDGPYYRGTAGDASQTFRMFGNAGKGAKQTASCTAQLTFPSDPQTIDEEAKMVRLDLDNCTNQYILNAAIYPDKKENPTLLSMEDGADRGQRISLASHCQPLLTVNETKNEYFAADYLRAAWIKLLQDPTYRKNPEAENEPHLPDGITIQNPIAPPSPFPDVRLSQIAAVPYEEINDPSHPYSPRWDYRYNERDHYSPMTITYQNPIMHNSEFSSVFCAGVRKANAQEENKSKADQTVKVDVLEFRRPVFDKWMMKRIAFNTACHADKATLVTPILAGPPYVLPHPAFLAMVASSYCYQIVTPPIPGPFGSPGLARRGRCWEDCYRLSGRVDAETSFPPCTTHHGGKDQSVKAPYLAGYLNSGSRLVSLKSLLKGGTRKASCDIGQKRSAENNIDTLCRDLRAPYTPLNKLKMRYHNPADPDTIVLKDGVQEGFTHQEYFGNHMPYPRLWDTGLSIQRSQTDQQDPYDTLGQYTAIVGVGHEASPGDNSNSASNTGNLTEREKKMLEMFKQDQRCLFGGWGSDVSMGGVSITLPDPIASWTEMKLYQSRTLRDLNISCLGRYEKSFKIGSAENMVLSALGAEYTRGIFTFPDGQGGYSYKTLAEARETGEATDATIAKFSQFKNEGWPLAWRGYMSAKNPAQQFPNFPGGATPKLITGLDAAELGDIILMPQGSTPNGFPGLPKLALVAEVNVPASSDCETRGNCFVKVIEADNGKWPDVCGTTDTWGEQKTRYLYKPGMLFEAAQNEYARIGATTNCEDPHLSYCELEAWDELRIYRVREDKRDGNASLSGDTP